jgi:hypothetical protein
MIGQTLGSYRVVSKIGEGGMGVVYLAEHEFLQRKAAVKVLLPVFSNDQEVVNRFINEAKAATVIHHPGIVQVFDFGKLPDGSAYLAMEYLEGESLDMRLKRLGRVSVPEALRITLHCASALAAAHQAGIVHRDLKPENIFLVPDSTAEGGERAKILDFGIAKLNDDHRGSVKTRTGSVMGTPTYMAPEQCQGADSVDHRADIYALACVMFHLLCGRPPFLGQGVGELLVAHITQPAPTVRSINPDVPPSLDALLQRALAKLPAERFASMAEFGAGLATLTGQARSGAWAPVAGMPYPNVPGSYPGTGPYAGPGMGQGMGSSPGMGQGMGQGMGSSPGMGQGMGQGMGSVPGMVPNMGSYPGMPSTPGTAPRMVSGSTLGAAAAQNLTHGTLPGSGRNKRAMIITAAAVATAVAGVLIFVLAGQEEIPVLEPLQEPAQENPDPQGTTPDTPTNPDVKPDVAPEVEPDVAPEVKPDVAPAVEPIRVEVTSEPAGAKVFATGGDEPLGVTPYTYEAAPSDGEITLRLELEGYKTAAVSFAGDRNGEARKALEKDSKRTGKRSPKKQSDDEFGYR